MNAHDDYMDTRSAFRAFERAYELWGQAVDGTEAGHFEDKAPEALQNRRGNNLVKSLETLVSAAQYAAGSARERGWGAVKTRQRKPGPHRHRHLAATATEDFRLCACGAVQRVLGLGRLSQEVWHPAPPLPRPKPRWPEGPLEAKAHGTAAGIEVVKGARYCRGCERGPYSEENLTEGGDGWPLCEACWEKVE